MCALVVCGCLTDSLNVVDVKCKVKYDLLCMYSSVLCTFVHMNIVCCDAIYGAPHPCLVIYKLSSSCVL